MSNLVILQIFCTACTSLVPRLVREPGNEAMHVPDDGRLLCEMFFSSQKSNLSRVSMELADDLC